MQMDTTYIDTSCHELTHLLGAIEMYGLWGDGEQMLHQGITLMSSGLTHLDPWHKLQFGWIEPGIISIHAGGRFTLPAAALGNPAAPLLLYDVGRGT
jgi:hypothetical protein